MPHLNQHLIRTYFSLTLKWLLTQCVWVSSVSFCMGKSKSLVGHFLNVSYNITDITKYGAFQPSSGSKHQSLTKTIWNIALWPPRFLHKGTESCNPFFLKRGLCSFRSYYKMWKSSRGWIILEAMVHLVVIRNTRSWWKFFLRICIRCFSHVVNSWLTSVCPFFTGGEFWWSSQPKV